MDITTIGVIAGNFDVLHPGYIAMLKECKKNCSWLVILLHEDPSVERPEKIKPILSVEERTEILYSLIMVDEVIPYETESMLHKFLASIKPDIRFLGDDYKNLKFTGDDLNIPIHYLSRDHGWSTTKYKTMIAKSIKL